MAAPMFPTNVHRFDPYRTFKFQILMAGQPVAGLSKMGALKKTTEVVDWRVGGDPSHVRKLPGGTKYEEITLEQGVTHDPVFEDWANLVNNIDGDAAVSLLGFRRDLILNVLNLQGQVAFSYQILRAWVSAFQALPDFDANSMNTIGIQTITIQNEGWKRDPAVVEPTES